ncbi:MAG: glutathione S-transferase family protein [SAR324 cluster bacterium]|nr:glutathione S-transferase family protein [SAR324 cluster bacterium]
MSYTLYYWQAPFRGNFIRLLLCDASQAYSEVDPSEILRIKNLPVDEQALPSMAPPFLMDETSGQFLSQLPAIVLYLAQKLELYPEDAYKAAVGTKLLLDANDVLAELTNYNGSYMWEEKLWKAFRATRLKRWMEIFEACGRQFGLQAESGFMLDAQQISFADHATYALWGSMIHYLPELEKDLKTNAPLVYNLCQRIGARPNLQGFLTEQSKRVDGNYCGGQIERSIRSMLALS